jgi:hypothetical protein
VRPRSAWTLLSSEQLRRDLQMQECHIRQQAQELYDSEELVSIRASVDREIARKRLVVRDDKDMYAGKDHQSLFPGVLGSPASDRPVGCADLNLREEFIGLLHSYQLPWLQVGLEVVLGVEITKVRLARGRDGQMLRLPTRDILRKLIVQVRCNMLARSSPRLFFVEKLSCAACFCSGS